MDPYIISAMARCLDFCWMIIGLFRGKPSTNIAGWTIPIFNRVHTSSKASFYIAMLVYRRVNGREHGRPLQPFVAPTMSTSMLQSGCINAFLTWNVPQIFNAWSKGDVEGAFQIYPKDALMRGTITARFWPVPPAAPPLVSEWYKCTVNSGISGTAPVYTPQ